jgi:hypothetical protein
MKTIKKLYRSTYFGESITTSMTYKDGAWEYESEHIPNSVINNQISNRAVVIGNGLSRSNFDLNLIKRHKGGLLASGALQSYGCNALYRDFAPHFLVANGSEIIEEISQSNYCNEHIVYTGARSILDYPGKFYLVPQEPSWNAGAIATYLAAFDGHTKIYLIGFDGIESLKYSNNIYGSSPGYAKPVYGYNDDFFVRAMLEVFNTYSEVEFVRVMPTANWAMPEAWKYCVNVRQIDYRDFALEVDL